MKRTVSAMFSLFLSLGAIHPVAAAATVPHPRLAEAVLAGGCFWGMEAVFERLRGVKNVNAGFSGGSAATAHYKDVSTGTTGHAESVKISYNPEQISYKQLLEVYFRVAHDPTELNYQGPDHGTQYRSAIFYTNQSQHRVAQEVINSLAAQHAFNQAIVTQIVPLHHFYTAENYHQHYYDLHPNQPYIVVEDVPKVQALQARFPKLFMQR